MLKNLSIITQNILFPPFCVICQRNTPLFPICRPCLHSLPRMTNACPRCAHPLPYSTICGQCLKRPPSFDTTLACFQYASPIKDLLYRFKINHELSLAPVFGRLMAHQIRAWLKHHAPPSYLLPMPLHPSRIRERGFNPSVEISKHLHQDINIKITNRLVKRIKNTNTQSNLPFKERRQNVKEAFKACQPIKHPIAIIDDVMTTGATANSLAKTLKEAGAPYVTVWCLAKTSMDAFG